MFISLFFRPSSHLLFFCWSLIQWQKQKTWWWWCRMDPFPILCLTWGWVDLLLCKISFPLLSTEVQTLFWVKLKLDMIQSYTGKEHPKRGFCRLFLVFEEDNFLLSSSENKCRGGKDVHQKSPFKKKRKGSHFFFFRYKEDEDEGHKDNNKSLVLLHVGYWNRTGRTLYEVLEGISLVNTGLWLELREHGLDIIVKRGRESGEGR